MEVLSIRKLAKTYGTKTTGEKVFSELDFSMEEGELVALMGPSGSGKTTLLNLISGIDKADSGEICLRGKNMRELPREERVNYRRTRIGMVFQDYHLIDSLNVHDNIILPMTLEGKYQDEIEERLEELVMKIGIKSILNQYPDTLSGGEKQRAAICRALVNHPELILADEPTGNLDLAAAEIVMEDFVKISEKSSILMVTHDANAASFCKKVAFFVDGKIQKEIHSKGDRQEFFVEILRELSQMGGKRA